MSFSDIINSDVQRRKKEVVIKVGDKEHKFYANELTYPQRLSIAVIEKNGGDAFGQMILFSITDKDGAHMSLDQVSRLSDEHAASFFFAATEVNRVEDEEKN